jgi:hypothetical protein
MTRNGPAQPAQAGAEPHPSGVPLRTYDDVAALWPIIASKSA